MAEIKTNDLSRPDLDNLLEGCQIIGFDWAYVYLNRTAEIHNRVANIELIGEKYQDKWPGIEETEVYRLIKDCLENRNAHRLENEFTYPDQTKGWFDLSIQPVPEGVFILSIDISRSKQITRELQMKEEHYHRLFDQTLEFKTLVSEMQVGVVIQGPDSEVLLSNPKALELLGLSEEQLIGRTSFDPDWNVIHEDGSPFPGNERPVVQSISKGIPIRDVIMGIYRPAYGDRMWVRADTIPQKNDDGSIRQVVVTFIDISKRKAAEEALRKSNASLEERVEERTSQLKAANMELEAFSYSVSHDLRAPLRSISGFTQILMDEYEPTLDTEGKRICKIIQDSAQNMGRLIDELLAFSKLSRSEMIVSRIIMKELVYTAFNEVTNPEIKVKVEFGIGDLDDSDGDPELIKQVWINLIQNSIKYSSKNEHIIISVSSNKENGFCVYCIKDNGVGFDMEFKDKLFGVFQRLHSVTEFEGSGVGLAIVQRIIYRHGGKVWAIGKVGKGAEFYFSLPEKSKNL